MIAREIAIVDKRKVFKETGGATRCDASELMENQCAINVVNCDSKRLEVILYIVCKISCACVAA